MQQRILWLAVRMVDHANHDRPAGDVKVGGHQASSASMVGIMTSLWFGHLSGDDKVAVKPHASPVYHAIKYLTGELDRSYLTRLRALGGLQAYPSRTKDPDVADFSTGSVGLGAVAPLFAAMARRYVEAHFGPQRPARFIALVGDAELDEGNIWEAIADPALQGLGNVTWIIDVNRQSLDRVIPGMKVHKLMKFFADSGWHVVEAKYGHLLQEAFARPGGEHLRGHIDDMSNEEYQSLFAFRGAELRERFLAGAGRRWRPPGRRARRRPRSAGAEPRRPRPAMSWPSLSSVRCEADPAERRVRLHRQGLGAAHRWATRSTTPRCSSPQQIDDLPRRARPHGRHRVGPLPGPHSPEGRLCASVGGTPQQPAASHPGPSCAIPVRPGPITSKPVSTQETFGRLLTALGNHPEVAERRW